MVSPPKKARVARFYLVIKMHKIPCNGNQAYCAILQKSFTENIYRDESILLLLTYFSFQQFFFFLPIMLKILLEVAIFCSKLSCKIHVLIVLLECIIQDVIH